MKRTAMLLATLMLVATLLPAVPVAPGATPPKVAAGGVEEQPPGLVLRIAGEEARGSGELDLVPDWSRIGLSPPGGQRLPADLVLTASRGELVEIRGSGKLGTAAALLRSAAPTAGAPTPEQPKLRLIYEQRFEAGGRVAAMSLLPAAQGPALLGYLDVGGREPIRREIVPGLVLEQVPATGEAVRGARAEVQHPYLIPGAAATRTGMAVKVTWAGNSWLLYGGQTQEVTHERAAYQLHVYRSLERRPGSNRSLPFEGERYLLSAVLLPR